MSHQLNMALQLQRDLKRLAGSAEDRQLVFNLGLLMQRSELLVNTLRSQEWTYVRDQDGVFLTQNLPPFDEPVIARWENGYEGSFILHKDSFGSEEQEMDGGPNMGPIISWRKEDTKVSLPVGKGKTDPVCPDCGFDHMQPLRMNVPANCLGCGKEMKL